MARSLSSKMTVDYPMRQYFYHPMMNEKIYIVYGGCYDIKLIRNTLAQYQYIYDEDGDLISWDHLKTLVECQEIHGLQAATKLSSQHLLWEDNKMNIRIAAQTLSMSNSIALKHLRDDLCFSEF